MSLLLWCLTAAAALPLLACITRPPGREAWLIAAAFGVSLLIDVVSYLVRAPGHGNAWVGYIGYPVQFALLVLAVAKDGPAIGIGLGGVLLIAMGSSAVPVSITIAGQEIVIPQETMLRGMAGLGIGYLVWENAALDWFRGPVMLYAVACIPFIIAMALLPRLESPWLWAFGAYSVVSLTAIVRMTIAILRGDARERGASGFPHTRQVNRATAGAS